MSGKNELTKPPDALLAELRGMIVDARQQVAQVANAALTMLYWHIGKRIRHEVLDAKRADYGQRIVASLGRQLASEFGAGFGEKNLHRMIQFAEAFPDEQIVAALRRQLGWTHFKALIPLKDPLKKDLEDAILREIESFLLELGDGFAFLARQKRLQIDSDDFYLDLLFYHRRLKRLIAIDLHPMRYESDEVSLCIRPPEHRRQSVLHRIHERPQAQTTRARPRERPINSTSFTSEAGLLRGLPLSGRRYETGKVSQDCVGQAVPQRPNRHLSHGVKLGDFKAEYKGQMELYLRWLAKHEQQPGEESPLGIILCAGKKEEQIELLELGQSGIHVAEYLTALPPRELLQQKLHAAIEISRARFENKDSGPESSPLEEGGEP